MDQDRIFSELFPMTVLLQIINMISAHSGCSVEKITSETRLVADLGIDGDDGHELLDALSEEFNVTMDDVDSFNYFDDEPPYAYYSFSGLCS